MTAPALHAAPEIGTSPPHTCLRCHGGAYAELREDCPHAFTIEALAPSPLVEVVAIPCGTLGDERRAALTAALREHLAARHTQSWRRFAARSLVRALRYGHPSDDRPSWDTESLYLASHNGAPPHAMHPTEDGARRLFAERWLWGQAIGALFGWLLAPDGYDVVGGEMLMFDLTRPGSLRIDGFHESNAEAVAAMDRAIEAAIIGTEGEAAEAFEALKARNAEAKREAATIAAGLSAGLAAAYGVASASPPPIVDPLAASMIASGRRIVVRGVSCDCGADRWLSLPEYGTEGWYLCAACVAAESGTSPFARVPDNLRQHRIIRRGCVEREAADFQCNCGGTTWLVREAGHVDEARCVSEPCGRTYVVARGAL